MTGQGFEAGSSRYPEPREHHPVLILGVPLFGNSMLTLFPLILGSKESLFSLTITASEEAMTVLEEVIMYTFQQCVYYISKVSLSETVYGSPNSVAQTTVQCGPERFSASCCSNACPAVHQRCSRPCVAAATVSDGNDAVSRRQMTHSCWHFFPPWNFTIATLQLCRQ